MYVVSTPTGTWGGKGNILPMIVFFVPKGVSKRCRRLVLRSICCGIGRSAIDGGDGSGSGGGSGGGGGRTGGRCITFGFFIVFGRGLSNFHPVIAWPPTARVVEANSSAAVAAIVAGTLLGAAVALYSQPCVLEGVLKGSSRWNRRQGGVDQ